MILYKQLLVLQEENKILKVEIAELKNRLKQNSNNSHKSPSSDPFRTRTNSKLAFPKNPEDKKPLGGQEGHEGKTLNMTDLPDLVELLKPQKKSCSSCGEDLSKLKVQETGKRRQEFDLPQEVKVKVREYRMTYVECCGKSIMANIPNK